MTEEQPLFSGVDINLEGAALLAHYSEFIEADRQLLPRLTFYRDGVAFMSVNSRSFTMEDGNESDRNAAIREMLQLYPSVMPDLGILSFADPVKLVTGFTDAIVMIAVNATTALTKVYPWGQDGEDVIFDMDAQLDSTSQDIYSPLVKHSIQVAIRTRRGVGTPTNLLNYLIDGGHDVSLYDDWDRSNLNARCYS